MKVILDYEWHTVNPTEDRGMTHWGNADRSLFQSGAMRGPLLSRLPMVWSISDFCGKAQRIANAQRRSQLITEGLARAGETS